MKRKITKRGRKRKIINTTWTSELAYVVGLIATDGNLSPDLRHINFTSKDKQLAYLYKKLLGLTNIVGKKSRGGEREKKYYVVQFGSVQFYDFLLLIGLTPAKSKTLRQLTVPDKFFWDFFRGCIDGDGNINEFSHPESAHMQLRIRLFSASRVFLEWQHKTIQRLGGICGGWVTNVPYKSVFSLTFGKGDTIKIIKKMYRDPHGPFLKRKHAFAEKYLVH